MISNSLGDPAKPPGRRPPRPGLTNGLRAGRRLVLAALAAASTTVAASDSRTTWLCWLHTDSVHAVCAVSVAGPAEPYEAGGHDSLPGGGTGSPRELVHRIRERPSRLKGQNILVPLHNVPVDDGSVGLLMRSVLCTTMSRCEARYHSDMGRLAAEAPELFVDMNDPVLVGMSR